MEGGRGLETDPMHAEEMRSRLAGRQASRGRRPWFSSQGSRGMRRSACEVSGPMRRSARMGSFLQLQRLTARRPCTALRCQSLDSAAIARVPPLAPPTLSSPIRSFPPNTQLRAHIRPTSPTLTLASHPALSGWFLRLSAVQPCVGPVPSPLRAQRAYPEGNPR